MLELSVSAIDQDPTVVWLTLASQVVAVVWMGVWMTGTNDLSRVC